MDKSKTKEILDKNKMTEIILRNTAVELDKGSVVNLGFGLPTDVSRYVTSEQQILFHGENGILGVGRELESHEVIEPNIISPSLAPTEPVLGASFFDSAISFGMIRGGHIDAVILGTMEVDEKGNIANYAVPGRLTGMGGAMDLCVGAKKVIVTTYHTQNGAPKILKKCTLPLTAQRVVTTIVTEKAVIDVTEKGLLLRKYNPYFTIEEIQSETGANLLIADDLQEMIY